MMTCVRDIPHCPMRIPLPAELHQTRIAAGLVLVGLALSATGGLLSPNGVVQFDDLTHYLYAKWAWRWPSYLLDNWGRPGFTAIYFLPAGWGWPACRLLSAILTAGSAWLAFRIAAMLGIRHAWAVVPLAYVQPLFFQLSQTTLTETPLALYLTLAVYLALRGRWSWSAAVISIGVVTRHEAVIFLPIWLLFAWRSHVPLRRLWPIIWAPVLVNGLALAAGTEPMFKQWLAPEPSTQYGHGGWLTYFARALHAFGPGVTVLAMTGLSGVVRRRGGGLIVACVVTYFATQTIIRALGLFASGGYARFLVPISPLVAIAALAGWSQLWQQGAAAQRRSALIASAMILLWLAMERQLVLHETRHVIAAELPEIHNAKWAIRISTAVIVLLATICVAGGANPRRQRYLRSLMPAATLGMILLAAYTLCRPLRPPPEATIINDMRAAMAERGLANRKIISACIWTDYVTDQALPPDRPSVRKRLEQAPVGSLFAWERQFAESADHNLHLDEFHRSGSFRLVLQTGPLPHHEEPYLRVFEKIGEWGLSEAGHTRVKNRRLPPTAMEASSAGR